MMGETDKTEEHGIVLNSVKVSVYYWGTNMNQEVILYSWIDQSLWSWGTNRKWKDGEGPTRNYIKSPLINLTLEQVFV